MVSSEQDYWGEEVEVETSDGKKITQETFLLRVYPEPLNGYDAYMDIKFTHPKPDFKKVYSSRLGITWEVVAGPAESLINGPFRGGDAPGTGNPPAWVFGLKKILPKAN